MIGTENPATDKSETVSEESRGTRRVDQQKLKTHIKMKTTKNYKENYSVICWIGYRSSREFG